MTMMRRDEGRKIGKERKETYAVQLSTRKLVDLVDVHGETIDDGARYGFDTQLDHFCAILIEEKLCYMKAKNEDKEDELLRHERMLFPVRTPGEQNPRVGMWTCERQRPVGCR